MAEGVEHAAEVSKTPGMAGWRRSQREWQHLPHGTSKPVLALVRARAPSKPCGPHAANAAILAEIVATQPSRAFWISPGDALRPPPHCNASGWPGCRYAISARFRGGRFPLDVQARLRQDRAPTPRPSRGVTIWRRAQRMPRRYPQHPGLLGGDDLSENGSICRTGIPSPFWGSFAQGR